MKVQVEVALATRGSESVGEDDPNAAFGTASRAASCPPSINVRSAGFGFGGSGGEDAHGPRPFPPAVSPGGVAYSAFTPFGGPAVVSPGGVAYSAFTHFGGPAVVSPGGVAYSAFTPGGFETGPAAEVVATMRQAQKTNLLLRSALASALKSLRQGVG